jgi:tetratricopeptide (TPR) repeat protein
MTISVSTLENILKQVESLKASAQTNSDFEDYDEALTDLDDAIALLRPTLEELEAMGSEDTEQYEPWRFKFARELADCYGMKGGNHRRKGELEQAEAAYEKGSILEVDYNIPDTYNRTNVIVLQLLRDPHRHETLGSMIQGARDIVHEQVTGKNKNKWWAWADFGLLNLLSVNLTETIQRALYQKEAHSAYEQFKNNGAGKQHFESTISVLEQLRESFKKVDEPTSLLMQEEIAYLTANMPAR